MNIVQDHYTNIFQIFKLGKLITKKSENKNYNLIKIRWRDNDIYGHVNNVVYGEWIDSIVNHYLIEKCSFNPLKSSSIGLVVSSHCFYYSPISYPSKISVGLFIPRIGKSSVDYKVGIFQNSECDLASSVGGFTHVFVDRITNRPKTLENLFKIKLLEISNIL